MRVHYFGEIADITGKTTDDVVLRNASVAELLSYLQSTHKLLVRRYSHSCKSSNSIKRKRHSTKRNR